MRKGRLARRELGVRYDEEMEGRRGMRSIGNGRWDMITREEGKVGQWKIERERERLHSSRAVIDQSTFCEEDTPCCKQSRSKAKQFRIVF
jgi:hypothetical protein